MTKAELIKKVAKNVGVPDTDAKIFFELFLKRISAVVEIGQSIFVKDFGYFHLIKGSIKKPVFSFKDNEVSEEAVELILFSEEKDLRKSDTKGIVFNIPSFDEEDYHPIDSTFSLSIGKPLIPLRGVPFDNIYIPTSGYEYRRLIESKVEKIIAASEIAESVENFPTLVIDARSYNSNQVQLLWDEKTELGTSEVLVSNYESATTTKPELSEYEKQSKELKNIAWDFGEDLSKQIEAESILDIADERINMDLNSKPIEKTIVIEKQEPDIVLENTQSEHENLIPDKDLTEIDQFVEEIHVDESSEKLNELLESENEPQEVFKEEILEENILEKFDEQMDEIVSESVADQTIIEIKSETTNIISLGDDKSDEEFWKTTSKYFEPYKPGIEEVDEGIVEEKTDLKFNPSDTLELENDSTKGNNIEIIDENILNSVIADEEINSESKKENQKISMDENNSEESVEDDIVLEPATEQKAEYFEPTKKKNLVPFIVFPLLVIGLSLALYWYLDFYKKGDVTPKVKQIVLKSENANFIERDFSIPVTYPYLPKVNETTISESLPPKTDESIINSEKTIDKKLDEKKTELKSINKENVKPPITETEKLDKNITLTGNGLNVGNNIFKYGNNYVVQVASFRASSISENEAGKFRNKGYNAFVEVAEIPNRGKWYRVRVGNFSTKEEAQSFIDKNIR
ncbi:MAG: SPOR domain-containing protein [Ignavibacteriales bacterium]|nr:SPOR domain-containing protein [Ignavibacteriales bacterium]